MSTWLDYWNAPDAMFTGSRHARAHAERFVDALPGIVSLTPGAVLLDLGCGEAPAAPRLAAAQVTVLLFDPSHHFEALLRDRHAAVDGITVLDVTGLDALAEGSVDVVLTNSVLQYLSRDEFAELAARVARLLAADGVWVLADVVAPGGGAMGDVGRMLLDSWRRGFLAESLLALLRLRRSRYRARRRELGLSAYSDADVEAVLAPHGLVARRTPENLGWSPDRRTYVARRAGVRVPGGGPAA